MPGAPSKAEWAHTFAVRSVQSVLAGLLLWAIYSILDVRYPTLLALWGGTVRLIPWFGALMAVLPALFIAIGSSPTLGIVAAVATIAVLFVLKEVIEPRVFHRHKYSSLLIVLFVIGLAEAFGFIGVILAPPFAVAVQILFEQLYPFPSSMFSQEVSEKVTDIRTRLLQLRRRIQSRTNRKNRHADQPHLLPGAKNRRLSSGILTNSPSFALAAANPLPKIPVQ